MTSPAKFRGVGSIASALALPFYLGSMLWAVTSDSAHGADAWPALEPARIGASFEEISQHAEFKCGAERKLCLFSSPGARLFAGVPVARIEAAFQDSRLQEVNVTLETLQFQALHRALSAHYGAGEDCSFIAIAGMAAEFTARVYVWRLGTVSIVLEEYAGKIDRSALTFGSESEPAMAELVRKVHSYPRGARRDL